MIILVSSVAGHLSSNMVPDLMHCSLNIYKLLVIWEERTSFSQMLIAIATSYNVNVRLKLSSHKNKRKAGN
jgi:hypothetical protein